MGQSWEEVWSPTDVSWDIELVRVYRERYRDLVHVAYLLTGQRAVAEEVVQDSFISVARATSRARCHYAYVRSDVVNRCRSWGRHVRLEDRHRPEPPGHAELVGNELWDALKVLSERQRVAIVLRYHEDLPDDHIAEILGCRLSTVRSLVRQGLLAMRSVLEP